MDWKHIFTVISQVGILLAVLSVIVLIVAAALCAAYDRFKESSK